MGLEERPVWDRGGTCLRGGRLAMVSNFHHWGALLSRSQGTQKWSGTDSMIENNMAFVCAQAGLCSLEM